MTTNKWVEHARAYRETHGCTFKEALIQSAATFHVQQNVIERALQQFRTSSSCKKENMHGQTAQLSNEAEESQHPSAE